MALRRYPALVKGILLAGGSGSRLRPLTDVVSKQLLPVYNKPMIYYPLSTLILMGIREVLLISTIEHQPQYTRLLGDGSQLGIKISYEVQRAPKGVPEALLIGESFLNGSRCVLMLGDNLLYGPGLGRNLANRISPTGATILAHHVSNPTAFGVVEFDENDEPIDILEKPVETNSNWAIPGLYFYDESVVDRARLLVPSARGELEISDLNRAYLHDKKLTVLKLSRGNAWLDMGTPKLLLDAGNFIQIVEDRQGLEVGNPFQIAVTMGLI